MQSKTALITGGTSGIGKATALQLAQQDMNIILACRNLDKAQNTINEISKISNAKISVEYLDLSILQSVYECAEALQKYNTPDILINNAGVFNISRSETVDNLEHTMAVNYYGHFLLTLLLLPGFIKAQKHIRIINVSSKAALHTDLNINTLQFKKRYHSFKSYSTSKLAQLYFTQELAKRLVKTKITVNAVHPGSVNTNIWNIRPNLLSKIIKKFAKTPEEGAKTVVYLSTSNEVIEKSGKFYSEKKLIPYTAKNSNRKKHIELWEHSLSIVKPWLDINSLPLVIE